MSETVDDIASEVNRLADAIAYVVVTKANCLPLFDGPKSAKVAADDIAGIVAPIIAPLLQRAEAAERVANTLLARRDVEATILGAIASGNQPTAELYRRERDLRFANDTAVAAYRASVPAAKEGT